MMYGLPKTLVVCGTSYEIRSDYRAVLELCTALSDVDLSDQEKMEAVLTIFYPAFPEDMPQEHYEEAIRQAFWFINCGDADNGGKAPKLVDWEKDFKVIVAPINRVTGTEIRTVEYMHWWTFIAAYYEIGDCLFAQIVRIREKKSKGRPLDKQDREWYNKNRHLVDFEGRYSEAEEQIAKKWGV